MDEPLEVIRRRCALYMERGIRRKNAGLSAKGVANRVTKQRSANQRLRRRRVQHEKKCKRNEFSYGGAEGAERDCKIGPVTGNGKRRISTRNS